MLKLYIVLAYIFRWICNVELYSNLEFNWICTFRFLHSIIYLAQKLKILEYKCSLFRFALKEKEKVEFGS